MRAPCNGFDRSSGWRCLRSAAVHVIRRRDDDGRRQWSCYDETYLARPLKCESETYTRTSIGGAGTLLDLASIAFPHASRASWLPVHSQSVSRSLAIHDAVRPTADCTVDWIMRSRADPLESPKSALVAAQKLLSLSSDLPI